MAETLDEPTGVREQDLHGTWRLHDWVIDYDDGRPASFPFGADATGLLIYAADGHVSAAIGRGGRARLSRDDIRRAPEAEKAAAFDSYFHYAGTWRLEGGQVVHEVTQSLNPNFVGTVQVRDLDLQGDRLELRAVVPTLSGATMTNRLVWRRATPRRGR